MGPSTAVEALPEARIRSPTAFKSATVAASIRAAVSSDGTGAPNIRVWAALRPARLAGLSSDIHSPPFSTALARDSSASVGPFSVRSRISSAQTCASSTARSAAAPA